MKRPRDLKSRTRRLVATERFGELVIEVAEEGLWMREKGRRTRYLLPYGRGYQMAAELHARREAQARKDARKERRRAR